MDLSGAIDTDEPMSGTAPPTMEQLVLQMQELMAEQRREHERQMAELRQQFQQQSQQQPQQQQQQQSTAAPPPPTAAQASPSARRPEPDYLQKQQLKALALTAFEGKMDHKLAVDFVKKIRLAGTVLRLRPALSAQDSNALIELAVGYFSDEPLNWFQLVVLESKYSTTYDEARIYGFPFTFDEFATMLIHRHSSTSATEDLWTELQKMSRKSYANAYAFHHAFLATAKMLGVYRETEKKGGRAFAIYLQKLNAREEMIYQSMLASLHRDRRTMYLDDVMTIVENAESNATGTTTAAAPAALAIPNAAPVTPSVSSSSEPTPMELDTMSARGRGRERVKCYRCSGYGHLSYQCATMDEHKRDGGPSGPRRGRGGYGGEGRGGRSGGRRGGRGGSGQVNQLEEGKDEAKGGRIIGEVRDGKVYALEKEEDSDF
jgi:hypothetical protein